MRVSVIVPAYNVASHIREALLSLQAQDYRDFEAVIVDDGSTDKTLEIIRTFCDTDSRFRWVTQANAGVSAARNRGLDLATGEFVMFLDGDDEYPLHALDRLLARADEFDADQVIGDYEVFDNTHSWHIPAMDRMLSASAYAPLDEALLTCYVIWNRLYRRSIIEATGLRFPPITFAEDSVFAMSYTYQCAIIATIPDDVYRYRKRDLTGERSATQMITIASERDHQAAHAAVREAAKARFAQERRLFGSDGRSAVEVRLASYRDALLLKEAGNLIDTRYSHFWTAEPGVIELIGRRIAEIKNEASLNMWDELVRTTREVSIESLPTDAAQVVQSAVVSVIAWSDGSDPAEYRATLDSLLSQRLANVLIYAPEELLGESGVCPASRPNLISMPQCGGPEFCNAVLDRCATEYLLVARSGIEYRPSALRRMHEKMSGTNYDFLSTPVARIERTGSSVVMRSQEVAFGAQSSASGTRMDGALALDFLFANKLLRLTYLRDRSFRFTESDFEDVGRLYRGAYYRHSAERLCGTRLRDADFAQRFLVNAQGQMESYRRRHLRRAVATWLEALIPTRGQADDELKAVSRRARRSRLRTMLQRALPVRKRVFFYSTRADGKLTGSSKLVYDALGDVPRTFAAKPEPHGVGFKARTLYHLITSRVIVTDDCLRYLRTVNLRPEQRVIQLWHATGALTTFELDRNPRSPSRENLDHRQYDAVIASSEWTGERYAHAFGIPLKRVLALGVPSTDRLLDQAGHEQIAERVFSSHPALRHARILLYAPMSRDDSLARAEFGAATDFAALAASLPEGAVLVICRHPDIAQGLLGGVTYPNILEPEDLSTDDAMIVADVLITDYSTIMFDFALLRRPVVLYCPDLEGYHRSFYLDFPERIGAAVARNQHELCTLLSAPEETLPRMNADFIQTQTGACDGASTARSAELIRAYLGRAL